MTGAKTRRRGVELTARTLWLAAPVLVGGTAQAGQDAPPTFGVRGTVLEVDHRPVSGADVRLLLEMPNGATVADATETDARGRFATRGWILSASDSDGTWRLEVSADGFATSVLDELFGGFGEYDVGPIFLFRPVTLSGRATDVRGQPIPGAEIRAVHGGATWSRHGYARQGPAARTNTRGEFELDCLPPGLATIGVAAAGYADFVKRDLFLSAARANFVAVQLEDARPKSGTVVDALGAPIAGALIDVPLDAFWRTGIPTDDRGRFVVEGVGPAWPEEWEVRALGFVGASMRKAPTDSDPVVLQRSRSFVVRAEREVGGAPVPIESITIHDSTPPRLCSLAYSQIDVFPHSPRIDRQGPSAWRIYSDSILADYYGSFDLPPSGITVRLGDGSWHWADLKHLDVMNDDILVQAKDTGGISGRVSQKDGRPVVGTTVMTNRWSVIQPDLVAVTDLDGRFSFSGMAAGDLHDVTVDNEYWRGRLGRIVVSPGTVTGNVELRVVPPPRIVGRLTFAGKTPGEPVVIGLGEIRPAGVVSAGRFGLGMSDANGNYSVIPKYNRRFTVVPKDRSSPDQGGYRRFRSEFPDTPRETWRWEVDAPQAGEVRLDIDLLR